MGALAEVHLEDGTNVNRAAEMGLDSMIPTLSSRRIIGPKCCRDRNDARHLQAKLRRVSIADDLRREQISLS